MWKDADLNLLVSIKTSETPINQYFWILNQLMRMGMYTGYKDSKELLDIAATHNGYLHGVIEWSYFHSGTCPCIDCAFDSSNGSNFCRQWNGVLWKHKWHPNWIKPIHKFHWLEPSNLQTNLCTTLHLWISWGREWDHSSHGQGRSWSLQILNTTHNGV